MTRWPGIRHIRYLWTSFCLWEFRRGKHANPSPAELALLNDIWEGRA